MIAMSNEREIVLLRHPTTLLRVEGLRAKQTRNSNTPTMTYASPVLCTAVGLLLAGPRGGERGVSEVACLRLVRNMSIATAVEI